MNMTQEQALKLLEYPIYKWSMDWDEREDGMNYTEAIEIAIAALRPISREQVEKVWRGEWKHEKIGKFNHLDQYTCSKCGFELPWNPSYLPIWCEKCGAPMTDEAVDILLKRLEVLHNE